MARFNFGYDEKLMGLDGPIQMAPDAVCQTCGDEYASRELLKGRCFGCRYKRAHKTKGRLEIQPSWSGASELDFKPRGV